MKKKKSTEFLCIFFLCFFQSVVFCIEPTKTRPFYQSSRALAMGDAFTAYGEGYDSFFYNPAGVARPYPVQAKYLDIGVLGSSRLVPLISSDYWLLANMPGLIQQAAKLKDKPYAVGIDYVPQILMKNFSVGAIARNYTEATIDGATNNMDFYGYADAGAYAQLGFAIGGGVVKFGAGVKVLDRAEVYHSYTPAQYNSGNISFGTEWKEGVGYGVDAGVLMTIPNQNQPTVGLTVQDIGDTKFTEQHNIFSGSSAIRGAPPAIKQRVNTGFSLNPKHSANVKSVFAVDYQDLLNQKIPSLDHIHLGWELRAGKSLSLRAGVNQGRYWTAGLGFRVVSVGIELATYGENVAFDEGGRRDDRKYVLRYVISF